MVEGKTNTSERRVLFTKWVGAAWELSSKMEMIVHSFEKYGTSVAPDGPEDEKININGLEDYNVVSEDPFSDEEGDENTSGASAE